MKKISSIIVDDERAARSEVRRMLEQYPEFVVEGEAKNADEAKAQIEQVRPEVIFLDIQMPGPSGFDLLGYTRISFHRPAKWRLKYPLHRLCCP